MNKDTMDILVQVFMDAHFLFLSGKNLGMDC